MSMIPGTDSNLTVNLAEGGPRASDDILFSYSFMGRRG